MRKAFLTGLISLLLTSMLSVPSDAVTNPEGPASGTPWLASIWVKDRAGGPDRQLCGGMLIAPTEVITAAHCVFEQEIAYIRLDMADGYEGRRIGVKARLWHQSYSKEANVNDIGLLKLAAPVEGVTVAKLPPVNDMPLRGLYSLSVAGYGEDENGQRPSEATMARQTDLTTEGSVYYDSFNDELLIAAGNLVDGSRNFSGACRGDSGGPLFATFGSTDVVVGIVSYGAADCRTTKPTVYTRVAAYLDWINEAVAFKSGT